MKPLVIVGAGGFGREVYAIVEAMRTSGADWEVEGFADDHPSSSNSIRVRALGSQVIASVSDLASRQNPYHAVIAVGSTTGRQSIASRLSGSPVSYPTLIHPHSTLGPALVLSEGVVVASGARLSTNITVGRHVHIDQNCTVGHDTEIRDFVRLNPQACVSGSVQIASRSTIGANATILQGIKIGEGATVGAGAVVTRDVPDRCIVAGVPARALRRANNPPTAN